MHYAIACRDRGVKTPPPLSHNIPCFDDIRRGRLMAWHALLSIKESQRERVRAHYVCCGQNEVSGATNLLQLGFNQDMTP